MTRVTVELDDAVYERLRDTAEREGRQVGELLADYARERTQPGVTPEVAAIVERQIRDHRSVFDRLAE